MATTETLEQWAARVAPTLTADGWLEAERCAKQQLAVLAVRKSRALLAHRDKVAARLKGRAGQTVLMRLVHNDKTIPPHHGTRCAGSTLRVAMDLARKCLAREIADRHYIGTDFGREIARLLKGQEQQR